MYDRHRTVPIIFLRLAAEYRWLHKGHRYRAVRYNPATVNPVGKILHFYVPAYERMKNPFSDAPLTYDKSEYRI